MSDEALRCERCAKESWPDGAIVLFVDQDESVATVRRVCVVCDGACIAGGEDPANVRVFRFGALGDVFDYADRVIPEHDWERGTVQRLSRVLVALHRRRGG